MKSSSKLFRAIVRRSPECIYIADRPVRLNCWVCDKDPNGTEVDPIFIDDESLENVKTKGNMMPFNTIVPVQLLKGGHLFARAHGDTETFLNISIEYLG